MSDYLCKMSGAQRMAMLAQVEHIIRCNDALNEAMRSETDLGIGIRTMPGHVAACKDSLHLARSLLVDYVNGMIQDAVHDTMSDAHDKIDAILADDGPLMTGVRGMLKGALHDV